MVKIVVVTDDTAARKHTALLFRPSHELISACPLESGPAEILKSFGRREAYESLG